MYNDDPRNNAPEWHKLLQDPQFKPLIKKTPVNFLIMLAVTLVGLFGLILLIEWVRALF